MGNYDDIINLPHHVSESRTHISKEERAAQFSPFAALTGFDGMIAEESRWVEDKTELAESEKERINRVLTEICSETTGKKPIVVITFRVPDSEKNGGVYTEIKDTVTKIDSDNCIIYLQSGVGIPFDDIADIYTVSC